MAQGLPPKVKVSSFQVEGNTLLSGNDLQRVLKPYEGRDLTFQELKGVADALTRLYQARGYFTVRVLLPEQTVAQEAVVRLVVAQNKIGNFKVVGNKRYSTAFIRRYFDDALKDPFPRRQEFERAVLLVNDFMKLKASMVLEPGEQPDTVDVTLSVSDKPLLGFGVDFNDYGSRYNGYNRPGAGLRLGNLSGNGDELSMHGFQSLAANGVTTGAFNYSIPVNNVGTKANAFYTNAAFGVGQDLTPLDIRGTASVYGVLFSHPFILEPEASLNFQGGFVLQNVHNLVLGSQTSRDFLRDLVVGATTDWTDPNGRWYGGIHLTQDLGTWIGGMRPNDPLSSNGAGGGFTKYVFDGARVQRINRQSYVIFRGSNQLANQPLPVPEQYSVGGVDTVRGYRQAVYLGDEGYNLGAEFRYSPSARRPDLFQVTAFVDHGGAYLKRPAPGTPPSLNLTGAGFGFRYKPDDHLTLNFDLGFPIGTNFITRTQGSNPVPYIYFSNDF